MKKKKEDIHDVIKAKFGTNIRDDERWQGKRHAEGGEFEQDKAGLDQVPEDASPYHNGEMPREARIRLRSIEAAWPKLTEKQRQIVQLCGIDGLSLDAAGKRLGISKDSARSRLDGARSVIEKLHKIREDEES